MVILCCFAVMALLGVSHATPSRCVEFSCAKATPTVDGIIGDTEYPSAFSWMFKIEPGVKEKNVFADRQARVYFAWDADNLYVGMKSAGNGLVARATERDGKLWEDDSIEIYVNSAPPNPVHQFIFNSIGALWDGRGVDTGWTSQGVVCRNVVKDGVWMFEAALPWRNFDIDVKDGNTFFVNVCRTYVGGCASSGGELKWIDDTCRTYSSSMAHRNYGVRDSFAAFTFRGKGARFSIGETGPLTDGSIDMDVEVTAAEDGTFKTDFWAQGPLPPSFSQYDRKAAHAGEKLTFRARGAFPQSGEFILKLIDGGGTQVFKGTAPFKKPIPVAYRWLKADPKRMELVLTTENALGKNKSAEIEFCARDSADESKTVWRAKIPAARVNGIAEQRVSIADLPPGEYKMQYRFTDGAGKSFTDDYAWFWKPGGEVPWTGCMAGSEDEVPLPWTAPVFREDGFACWGRTVGLGPGGLITSVVSQGRELLAAPVRLLVDGKPVSFSVKSVDRHVSYADYSLAADDGAVPIRVKIRAEFDGFIWFDIERGAGPVQSLAVELPMKRDFVTGFDDGHSVIEKLPLGRGVRGTWNVDPREYPFFWIGDGATGMMGGTEDQHGWKLKDKKSGYRVDVDGETAKVTIRFVDTPDRSDKPQNAGFYLNPTPVRPKNAALEQFDAAKMCRWTGNVADFCDMKRPGHMLEDRIERYQKRQRNGERVFWYGGSALVGAYSPLWAWYCDEWNFTGDPSTVYLEISPRERAKRDQSGWIWGCLRNKSFFDFKLWSASWFLNAPEYGVRDLYFDISFPKPCRNAGHGCKWTDGFGVENNDFFFRGMREFHKRVYRQLKRKNPEAAMMGHVRFVRTPSDNFFDESWCGEAYERNVALQHNYYGLLQPEAMQIHYASRANDMVMGISCQIYRTYQVYCPHLLASYDPYEPASDRAIRHAAAYFKIHNLLITVRPDEPIIGKQWWKAESCAQPCGKDRRFSAYCLTDCPVRIDRPDRLFLHAVYTGNGRAMLILLNDTDATVTKTVSADPKALGLRSAKGSDMFGHGEYSLETGSFTVELPPRESRFILFGGGAE